MAMLVRSRSPRSRGCGTERSPTTRGASGGALHNAGSLRVAAHHYHCASPLLQISECSWDEGRWEPFRPLARRSKRAGCVSRVLALLEVVRCSPILRTAGTPWISPTACISFTSVPGQTKPKSRDVERSSSDDALLMIRSLPSHGRDSLGLGMADEPTTALIKASVSHYESSRAHVDVTERLIEQSRKAVRSSRDLLDRTHPISFSDPVAR
jgi:hypothetical protein